MRYSPSTNGFYPESIAYPNLPGDVVAVSAADYSAAMEGQAAGKQIVAVDGKPVAQDMPAPTLEQKRASAVLSRSEFMTAVYQAGILSKSEAVAAAAGGVPQFFLTALSDRVASGAITQMRADSDEILWSSLTQVERNHELIPIAQVALSLTDAQVDALFGIA